MALIAAGLAAEGQSRLSPLETVERGYGQLVDRLKMPGRAGGAGRAKSAATSGLTTFPSRFSAVWPRRRDPSESCKGPGAAAPTSCSSSSSSVTLRSQLDGAADPLAPLQIVHTHDHAFRDGGMRRAALLRFRVRRSCAPPLFMMSTLERPSSRYAPSSMTAASPVRNQPSTNGLVVVLRPPPVLGEHAGSFELQLSIRPGVRQLPGAVGRQNRDAARHAAGWPAPCRPQSCRSARAARGR